MQERRRLAKTKISTCVSSTVWPNTKRITRKLVWLSVSLRQLMIRKERALYQSLRRQYWLSQRQRPAISSMGEVENTGDIK
jgi:hypothetical protein